VDEMDCALQGDHFHRLIAHIEVEDGMGFGQDRAEGGGRLDHPVGAFVIEPCDSRGEVDIRSVALQSEELDLRTTPYPDPESVGHHELGSRSRLGVERIVHAERRVLDRGDPILGLRHKTQNLALRVGNAADQDRFLR
jgi:hypothetical protein